MGYRRSLVVCIHVVRSAIWAAISSVALLVLLVSFAVYGQDLAEVQVYQVATAQYAIDATLKDYYLEINGDAIAQVLFKDEPLAIDGGNLVMTHWGSDHPMRYGRKSNRRSDIAGNRRTKLKPELLAPALIAKRNNYITSSACGASCRTLPEGRFPTGSGKRARGWFRRRCR